MGVAGAALLVIAAAELVLRGPVPPLETRMEVVDGMADYEANDPHLLVLGSSHARGFSVIRERLNAANGYQTVQMAVERGKLTSYQWVLQNRLAPLIEGGHKKRLERVLLVTEWWDSCRPPFQPAQNIPGRAWTFGHFLADFADKGLTPYNRNWVNYQWTRRVHGSILLSDRGVGRAADYLLRQVRPRPPEYDQANHDNRVLWWQSMVESGFGDAECFHNSELTAAAEIIDYFTARNVEVTLILYPRMPATISDKAKQTTLSRYRRLMEQLTHEKGVRLVDLSYNTPLTDNDFMSDFDHTTAEGNAKLADHTLAGPLSFLLTPRGAAAP